MPTKINKTQESFIDTIVLGQAHSMMTGNVSPKVDIDKAIEAYQSTIESKKSIESFGLFSNGINYNTFYPELDLEDINPKDEEFITPMFRLLSACVVNKNYWPTDFSEGNVLKNSMNLLLGQTVNCDHETDVGNAIGAIKEIKWQNSFEQDGVTVPAGINGILKIDAKSNPRIARGILMDPPSIHSNSVTVTFKWKPSHTFDNMWEFYDAMGTYDDKGELVRRIVTEIVSFSETSLVSHGADPFAQKIDNNKLNNIVHAAKSYYGSMQNSDKLLNNLNDKIFSNIDFKSREYNSTMVNSERSNIETIINLKSTKQHMNELELLLSQLFGDDKLQLEEGATASAELAVKAIEELVKANSGYTEEIERLTGEVTKLNQELKDHKTFAEVGKNHEKQIRELALANYTKLSGESTDEAILSLLNSESTNVTTLIALNNTYTQSLEKLYPMSCSKCGSHDINRSSAITEGEEETTKNSHESQSDSSNSIESTIQQISNLKK